MRVFNIFDSIFFLFLLVLLVIVSFSSLIKSCVLLCVRFIVKLLIFLIGVFWDLLIFFISLMLFMEMYEVEVRDVILLFWVFGVYLLWENE